MNIICGCFSYWNSAEEAEKKAVELTEWCQRVDYLFRPTHKFIACGSYSDPMFNPVSECTIVNSGVPYTKGYDVFYWQYSLCAKTAACWHVINMEWDLFIMLDSDTVFGTIDLHSLVSYFTKLDKNILAAQWGSGGLEMIFSVWKREAVMRYLHMRRRPNLVEDITMQVDLPEYEEAEIFGGHWYNPWPSIKSFRQDYGYSHSFRDDREVIDLPFVRLPSPAIREVFNHRTQIPLQ